MPTVTPTAFPHGLRCLECHLLITGEYVALPVDDDCDEILCPVCAFGGDDPAPAGGLPPATTAPVGAPLYSEDRCDNGHVLDCCGNCRCERTQHD